MKDTKRNKKVASQKGNALAKPMTEKPGPQDYPYQVDNLTETEMSLVTALRDARRCEDSWDALYNREAWWFIHEITSYVLQGTSKESLEPKYEAELFAVAYPAAVAAADTIRLIVAQLTEDRLACSETGIDIQREVTPKVH